MISIFGVLHNIHTKALVSSNLTILRVSKCDWSQKFIPEMKERTIGAYVAVVLDDEFNPSYPTSELT